MCYQLNLNYPVSNKESKGLFRLLEILTFKRACT